MEQLVVIGSAEIYFAKKLANNEKKVRDKALRRLQLWLKSKVSSNIIEEEDLLKIWKGLFYCMWYSDKLLVQEELAENISKIIHAFKDDGAAGILFSKTFFCTMGREWLGIDRLRLDKFYLLAKKVLYTTLVFISRSSWNDELVSSFVMFLKEYLLSSKYPDGMKLYLSEKFFDQVKLLYENKPDEVMMSEGTFMKLLRPFIECLAHVESSSVIGVLKDEIFGSLNKLKIRNKSENGKLKALKIPFEEISKCLVEIANNNKNIATKNRKLLYGYADSYRKHLEAIEERKKNPRKRKANKANPSKEDITKVKKKKSNEVVSDTQPTSKESNQQAKEKVTKKKKQKQKKRKIEKQDELEHNKESNTEEKEINFTESPTVNGNIDDLNDATPISEIGKEENNVNFSFSEDDEVSFPNIDKFKKETKQKLNFTESDNSSVDFNVNLNGVDHTPSDNKVDTVKRSKDRKKIRKSKRLEESDMPAPIKFVNTPPPAAFFRKAVLKSAQPKKQKKIVIKTPKSVPNNKKVTINLSNNKSINEKDLKINPMRPFSPTRRPSKSAIRTPNSSARPTAEDFF